MALGGQRTVLFDLDGTLVDSAPDLTTAVDRMLRDLGRAPVGEEAVRHWIGNGARRLVMRALTGQRDGDPGDAATDAALARFFDHYDDSLTDASVPYPGAMEALRALSGAGVRLGVVTNKPARFTDRLLDALDMLPFFGVTVSGDTLPVKKPDPAPLRLAADRLGVPLETCVMVGDSMADLRAARNAGIPMVCVPYGYRDGDAIFEAGPEAVVQRLDELPALLGLNDHGRSDS
jgi:phosphoglycolate phosphatase